MEKALLIINGKEYELKFTIGFWKRVKESCGVTDKNIEQRLAEDFGTVATHIILDSIIGQDKPSVAEIESAVDRTVMDVFEQALINGMTKAERELYDLAMRRRAKAIKGIEGDSKSPSVESVNEGGEEEGKK